MSHSRRQPDEAPVQRRSAAFIGTVIALTYLILIPLALHVVTTGTADFYIFQVQRGLASVLLAAIHVYASLRMAVLSTSPSPPIMRFPFWAFVYVWIANVPAVQFATGRMPWGMSFSTEAYENAILVIIAGLVTYEIGGMCARSHQRGRLRANAPLRQVTGKRLIMLVLGSCMMVIAIAPSLGMEALFGAREDRTAAVAESLQGRLAIGSLLRAPILVSFLALLSLAFTGFHTRIPFFKALFAGAAICCLVANFPTAVSRAWFGGAVLGMLAVTAISRRANLYGKVGLPLVASFLLIFPLFDQFRRATEFDIGVLSGTRSFTGGGFDALQMHTAIVHFVKEESLQWGRQFLGPLFFWVPRSLWPGKPVGTGAFVAEQTGMTFTNVSAPLWSEAYINFGMAGVVTAFTLYGWLSRKWELQLSQRQQNLRLTVFAGFLSGFQVFMLRGDLMSTVTFFLPFALVCWFGLNSSPVYPRAANRSADLRRNRG